MDRPIVGITMGDPCGVGPEIIAKALGSPEVYLCCKPLVIGDREVMERALRICRVDSRVRVADAPGQGQYTFGAIDLLEDGAPGSREFQFGRIQAEGGMAAYRYVTKAAQLAVAGEIEAVATAPIHKESLHAAHVPYIGHTEIFSAVTGAKDPLTMFEVRNLRIFFLSRHVSLHKACELVKGPRVRDYIIRCGDALKSIGIVGTLAVAGLNPHCGEHGLLGDEEVEHLEPAVREARSMGCDAIGPIAADSVFHLALKNGYAAVLAMYHDQGHIAAKTLDFERTISLTLGLPFLRTSVDHGTAFDIAGSGKANAVSMVEAIKAAVRYGMVKKGK